MRLPIALLLGGLFWAFCCCWPTTPVLAKVQYTPPPAKKVLARKKPFKKYRRSRSKPSRQGQTKDWYSTLKTILFVTVLIGFGILLVLALANANLLLAGGVLLGYAFFIAMYAYLTSFETVKTGRIEFLMAALGVLTGGLLLYGFLLGMPLLWISGLVAGALLLTVVIIAVLRLSRRKRRFVE